MLKLYVYVCDLILGSIVDLLDQLECTDPALSDFWELAGIKMPKAS